MKRSFQRAAAYLRGDPVMCGAMLAAVGSSFWVPPSPAYIAYLDWRVLSLLLSLMLVVAGLQKGGLFGVCIRGLLGRVHHTRALAGALVGVCFFSSMLMTNDVALITAVPLAIMVLTQAGKESLLIPVIVLQTVAANLGSMLTPLGNPQNLYLYSLSGMTAGQFLGRMAVPTALSFLLLAASVFLLKAEPVELPEGEAEMNGVLPWVLLFAVCLLAVVRILPAWIALALVAGTALALDRKLLLRADYGLLLTFVLFFIFIGNIKQIPAISAALSALVGGRELSVGILLSQVISNVPAAMLLSGFTDEYSTLLLGVNLGGLGTLIASMASLISYKQYAATAGAQTRRYLAVFTLTNLAFLAVLWGSMAVWTAA